MTDKKKGKELIKNKPLKKVAVNEGGKILAWVCAAGIAVITFVVFSPSLGNGFTNYDDPNYVTGNSLVVNDTLQVAKIFETPVASNYHPLTILSLALNYQSDKSDPSGYHVENVLFHILNTILVFFFVFLLTRCNLLMASIVALFFGIHPMHVESVSWVSERKDVLYVFFFMAGLITYLRYSDTKKISWYIFTLLLFILSCLSKGMALVFPVILLLIDYLNGVKWERRLLLEKIPFFLFAIVFGIIAIKAQQTGLAFKGMISYTVLQRLLFASYGAIFYIVKLFVPYKLSAFYPYPDTANIPLTVYLSPLLLLGIAVAVIYFFLKKEKELVFGLLFYFVTVALVLQIVSVGYAIAADRYSYLSYIGLLFALAYLIDKAWTRYSRNVSMKYTVATLVIIGAVVFSVQTYSRTQVWKNSDTLWTDVIENYPNANIAYDSRGKYYQYDSHEPEKAMADYNKSIELNSILPDDYNNRGLLYYNSGKPNIAMADFNKTITLDSNDANAYSNRAMVYLSRGNNDSVLINCNKAIAHDPANSQYYFNRGLLYSAIKQNEKALADFSKAIELNPTVAAYWKNRAFVEHTMGRDDMARNDAVQAQQLQGR